MDKNSYEKSRYKEVIASAKENLGNKCVWCHAKENLVFHHIDPETKSSTVTKLWSSTTKFLKELEKCILLCKSCHKLNHAPEHGTRSRYVHYKCTCPLCNEANNTYLSNYKTKN